MSTARQRVDFDLTQFDSLMSQKGLNLLHERRVSCPCLSDEDSTPAPDCPLCFGSGHYYLPAVTIQGILTSMNADYSLGSEGISEVGAVMISAMASTRLAFRDRITLPDARVVFSESISFDGTTDPLNPALRYNILDCQGVVGLDGTIYDPYADYKVNPDGTFTWLNASPPDKYGIRYLTYPRWLLMNFGHLVRGILTKFKQPSIEYVELPIQAMGRLEWMVEK